jgi:hypothetical protein
MEAITSRSLLLRHRHAGAACDTNNDHRGEFTREGGSGRGGVSRSRHFFYANSQKKTAQLTGLQRWRLSSREPSRFSFRAINCGRPRAS